MAQKRTAIVYKTGPKRYAYRFINAKGVYEVSTKYWSSTGLAAQAATKAGFLVQYET